MRKAVLFTGLDTTYLEVVAALARNAWGREVRTLQPSEFHVELERDAQWSGVLVAGAKAALDLVGRARRAGHREPAVALIRELDPPTSHAMARLACMPLLAPVSLDDIAALEPLWQTPGPAHGPEVLGNVVERYAKEHGLRRQERRIVAALTSGKTPAEVRAILEIKPKTYETHVTRILRATGTGTVARLVEEILRRTIAQLDRG